MVGQFLLNDLAGYLLKAGQGDSYIKDGGWGTWWISDVRVRGFLLNWLSRILAKTGQGRLKTGWGQGWSIVEKRVQRSLIKDWSERESLWLEPFELGTVITYILEIKN